MSSNTMSIFVQSLMIAFERDFRFGNRPTFFKRLIWVTAPIVLMGGICGCQPEVTSRASQAGESVPVKSVNVIENQTVSIACGECQFGMPGSGCDLAVQINGQNYFVDGSSIDDHGDAHDADGLCNCVRTARVSGKIRDGRFQASQILVLPKDTDGESTK